MNLLKTIKCICVLVKCSKYLYYAKKLLCITVIILTGAFAFGFCIDSKSIMKSLKGKR